MALLDVFRKSQRTVLSTDPAQAWDLGLDSVGDFMAIYEQINRMLKGSGGGVVKYEGTGELLRLSLVSWGYACIDRIAREISQAEWVLHKKFKRNGEVVWEPVDLEASANMKAADFMKRLEEPFSYGTEATLKELWCRQLDACGYSPSIIEKAGNSIASIIPSSPANLKPTRTNDGRITGWLLAGGRKYLPEEVLYIYYPDPRNCFMPLSPLSAASYGLDINQSAFNYNAKLLKNDARPSGWFIPKTDIPLDEKKLRAIKDWLDKVRGKIGGIEVPPLGGTIQGTSMNPRDMDFNEGLKSASNEVSSAFGYPRPLITGEQINKSVMEVLLHLKNQACIIPRMVTIETAVTIQLVRPYLGNDYWLAFERPVSVFSDAAARLVEEVKVGIRTINEVRAERGEDPVSWGDEPPSAPAPMNYSQSSDRFTPEKPPVEEAPKSLVVKLAPQRLYKDAGERMWLWKSFDGLMRATERPMMRSVARSFKRQARTVADRIKARAERGEMIDASVFNPAEAEADMEKAVKEHVENGVWAGRDRAASLLRREIPVNEAKLERWIDNYAKENASLVTLTTAALIQGYMDGHRIGEPEKALDTGIINVTLSEYVKELTEIIDSTGRAGNIAETMTLGSINWGTFNGYQDAGVEKKEWLSQQDGRVRGSDPNDIYNHRLDGGTIPMGSKFNTGTPGGLEYPGDPSGDPGDICNCRCTVLPVFGE